MNKNRQPGFGACYVLVVQVAMLVWLLPEATQAADVIEHLYDVSILVADQSDAVRQKALSEGLEKVITRVSGQIDWQANPAIQEALSAPDAYVQQFGFASLSDAEMADLKAKETRKSRFVSKDKEQGLSEPLPTAKVNVSFSPESIKALLRRAQLPLWPNKRPSVLVWVVIDNGTGSKEILGQGNIGQDVVIQESARRGLPVVMPMNDLNDQLVLGVDRLWQLDQTAIKEASQRYGEDSILVGRVAQTTPGQWQGNWLYLLKGQTQLVESKADDLEDFLTAGINVAVQAQVQRYGINPAATTNRVLLDISGVDSLKRYAAVLEFLKKLDLVTALAVTDVKEDLLHCALDINGDKRLLQALIGLDGMLVSDEPFSEDDTSPDQPPVVPTVAQDVAAVLRYHVAVQ